MRGSLIGRCSERGLTPTVSGGMARNRARSAASKKRPVILSGAPRGLWSRRKRVGCGGVLGGAESKDLSLFLLGKPVGRRSARPPAYHRLSRAPPPRGSFDSAPSHTPA